MIERRCLECEGVFYAFTHSMKKRFCSKACADRAGRRKRKTTIARVMFPKIERAPRQVITRQRPEPITRDR